MKPTAYLSILGLTGAAFLAAVGLAQPAQAVPISYALSNFGPPTIGSDGFTGTFTFDSAVPSLISVDITVTGPFLADVFTVPVLASDTHKGCGPLSGFSLSLGSCFVAADTSGSEQLLLTFTQLLSTEKDLAGSFAVANSRFVFDGAFAFGEADPVSLPEPATVSLFGAALVGLGLMRRRRGV